MEDHLRTNPILMGHLVAFKKPTKHCCQMKNLNLDYRVLFPAVSFNQFPSQHHHDGGLVHAGRRRLHHLQPASRLALGSRGQAAPGDVGGDLEHDPGLPRPRPGLLPPVSAQVNRVGRSGPWHSRVCRNMHRKTF